MLKKMDSPGSKTISQSSRKHRKQKRAAQDYAQNGRHHCHQPTQPLSGTAPFLMQSEEVVQETTAQPHWLISLTALSHPQDRKVE